MSVPRPLLLLSACLLLAACATANAPAKTAGSAPVSQGIVDPPDSALNGAIAAFLAANRSPAYSRYDYSRVDLDNDGRRDALVMFSLPYSYWCGPNGCSLTVFHAVNTGFVPQSELFPVRGPMYIGRNTTGGWHDLIVHVSGLPAMDAKTVALHFNGTGYPRNPVYEPGAPVTTADFEQRLFP